jgi:hypothetical protein
MPLRLDRFIVDFQNRFSRRGAAIWLGFVVDFQNRFLCRGAAFDSSPAFQRRLSGLTRDTLDIKIGGSLWSAAA